MKVQHVTHKSIFKNELCAHCGRKVLQGQRVLTRTYNDAGVPYTKRLFALHVSCVRSLIANCPPDQDLMAFDRLKQTIHTKGRFLTSGN